MRRALLLAPAAAAAFTLGTLGALTPAAAHVAGPCDVTDEPGHSGYAAHHIVALAQIGGLGADGHVPGSHRGYSACLGVHP